MKKITEELNRFNSINKYISEQLNPVDNTVSDAYNIILDGFEDFGTNPKYIIDGLNMLDNSNQFIELNNLFVAKKPDGYGSFQDMINGEFEYNNSVSTNENDLNKIYAKLKSWGIMSTIGKVNNRHKEGSYKITLPVQTKVEEPATKVIDKKQPVVKVNPVLQQTMTINKQIQQKLGITQTGKLTHNELEVLIKTLTPNATPTQQ